jgi:hypothetical protein
LRTVRSTLRAASSRSVQRAAIAISDSSVYSGVVPSSTPLTSRWVTRSA